MHQRPAGGPGPGGGGQEGRFGGALFDLRVLDLCTSCCYCLTVLVFFSGLSVGERGSGLPVEDVHLVLVDALGAAEVQTLLPRARGDVLLRRLQPLAPVANLLQTTDNNGC